MGRLTSARNNGSGGEAQLHGNAAQALTIAVIAFLAHRGGAVPVPPTAPSGCCVSYGLTYDHIECCHEFTSLSRAAECTVTPGWVGGGMRYHDETSCEDAKELPMYDFSSAPEPELLLDSDGNVYTDDVNEDTGDAAGCCVSFGLSGTEECCHEFTSSSAQEECVLPPGFVGGGRRFHDMACKQAQQLTQYILRDTIEEGPASEARVGDWNAAVYTDEQQARLGVDMWGDPVDDPADQESDTPTQQLGQSADRDQPSGTGRTQPVSYSLVTDVPAAGYGYGAGSSPDENQQTPSVEDRMPVDGMADDQTIEQNDPGVRIVGGSQGLGPAWTQDDSIEPPAGEQEDMGGWDVAVYTPEQQAWLGVDENGVSLTDDIDHTEADFDAGSNATMTSDDQETFDVFQAAGFPGVLPVLVDPGPSPDDVETDSPCYSLPATSMAIVPYNPQCDEKGQFLPVQCDRTGDCWCVDNFGEPLDANILAYADAQHPSEETCTAARAFALQASDPTDSDGEHSDSDNIPPALVDSGTQTSFTPTEAFPAYDNDSQHRDGEFVIDSSTTSQSAPATHAVEAVDTNANTDSSSISKSAGSMAPQTSPAPISTSSNSGELSSSAVSPATSGLSLQRWRLFPWIAGGAAGLVLLSALIAKGAQRYHRSSNLRASAYLGFSAQEARGRTSSEYQRARQPAAAPPSWSRSWIVSGVERGAGLSTPVEPAAPPPGGLQLDRVSLVGMPRLPSTLQFSTDGR